MAGREFFLWQVRSFTIRVSLDLVEALSAALADSRNKSDIELGGILKGRELSPHEIEISGFEFFESQHRRGVIYSLGLREQLSLSERAARQKAVGFFRTHLRPGLFLDQDDFALMQEAFGNPSQIALLIRPLNPGPSNAGVFTWEDGDIDRRRTSVFPFDSATLRAQGPIEAEAAPVPRQRPARTPFKLPAVPTIPIRWVGWGAATATAALALGAVLPMIQFRPVVVHHQARAIPVRTIKPAPVVIAKAEAPVVAPPVFVAPKPDEGRSDVEPVRPVEKIYTRVFEPPKPAPEPEIKPVVAAVAPPPFIPVAALAVAEKAAEPIPEPALPAPPRPEPPRPEPAAVRKPAVQVAVSVETRESSELTKVVGHVPLFGHFAHAEGGKEFSPARPGSSIEPRVPSSLASDFNGTLAVDVRLSIDKYGAVTNYEVLHGAGTQFASLAVSTAGNAAWEPARQGDRRVNSDVILHYRFQTR